MMSLRKAMMEHKLIHAMQRYLKGQRAPLDDCAVLSKGELGVGDGCDQLVTSDMLMDGVHFLTAEQPLSQIGYKAMAVNISDIAAMAGTAKQAFISLALPSALATEAAIAELYSGLSRCAEPFGVVLAGGDTNIWQGPLVISVTLLGSAPSGGAILRRGAKSGDRVLVTGALGGSLSRGRHLSFTPRIAAAKWLAERVALRGMADISDGLATDLRHIMALSGVGITLDGAAIPIHDDVPAGDAQQRLYAALTDGEDFELVFCCSPEDAKALASEPNPPVPCRDIGVCCEDHRELRLNFQGQETAFRRHGYRHGYRHGSDSDP